MIIIKPGYYFFGVKAKKNERYVIKGGDYYLIFTGSILKVNVNVEYIRITESYRIFKFNWKKLKFTLLHELNENGKVVVYSGING